MLVSGQTVLFLLVVFSAAVPLAVSVDASYTNPVIVPNSPDPGVVFHDNAFYAVTTSNGGGDLFPIHMSHDLVNWRLVHYVFPDKSNTRPKWAVSDFWAPELHVIDGNLRVYFVARDHTGVLCVGVATAISSHPKGPYKDLGHPLVRNASMGSIDPTMLKHGSDLYLYWKADGNAVRQPTPIYVQPLSDGGLSLARDTHPKELIRNDLPWEGICTEGPWVVKKDNYFYLFYSGNMYDTSLYSVGVARSTSPTGPFTKHGPPILHSSQPNNKFAGPGHCSVLPFNSASEARENWYIVYHAWNRGEVGAPHPRHMLTDKVEWVDGWPRINQGNPSDTAQPIPS